MFENPRRGRQARNFTTNAPKILDRKPSSEQIFSENCRWVPLNHPPYLRTNLKLKKLKESQVYSQARSRVSPPFHMGPLNELLFLSESVYNYTDCSCKLVVNFIFTSDHLSMSACVITAGLNHPQRAHHGLPINFGKFPITLLALTLSLPNLARKKLFIVETRNKKLIYETRNLSMKFLVQSNNK